jgi:hypothetical protein
LTLGGDSMKVLIGCEFSGRVRDAFSALGHDAWSCDLVASETAGNHIKGDILSYLDNGWDLAVMHPPCTHLAVSGAAWFAAKRADGRQQQGIDFFMALANAPIEKICVENPIGIMSKQWRKPDQIIQPWQYGEEAQKSTCLWLKNLPLLVPTNIVGKGEMVKYASGKSMPKWYADAWKLPKEERAKLRNRTFQGIADAMAAQWGGPNK